MAAVSGMWTSVLGALPFYGSPFKTGATPSACTPLHSPIPIPQLRGSSSQDKGPAGKGISGPKNHPVGREDRRQFWGSASIGASSCLYLWDPVTAPPPLAASPNHHPSPSIFTPEKMQAQKENCLSTENMGCCQLPAFQDSAVPCWA